MGLKINTVIILSFLASNLLKCQEVEFRYIKNQIILPVFINDNGPYNMLLDTGVDPSVIDLQILKEIGVAIDSTDFGKAEGRGEDEVKVFPIVIDQLSIGDKEKHKLETLAMNLSHLGDPLGIKLHGIIGYSYIKDKMFKIDYENHTLTFFNNRNNLNASIRNQFHIVKFFHDGEDMIPLINDCSVNGFDFIGSVDTGSSLNIQIYKHRLEKFNISRDSVKDSQIVGAQGVKKILKSTVPKVQLGDFIFYDQELSISDIKNKKQLRDGNIGNKFLQNFKVAFDYSNNEIIFEIK
ncbi:MAG: aspartyl protease family protein [Flavobacteriaceae bacterium]|nr:aspartyl protease family protein [Flavobacteriaceae bacterium]